MKRVYQDIKRKGARQVKEETATKLNVLMDAKKIDSKDLSFIKKVDSKIIDSFGEVDNEMLLIHLGVALERTKNKEEVDEIPREVWQQVINREEFSRAKNFWKECKALVPVMLPKEEESYILMHLVNIIRSVQNG